MKSRFPFFAGRHIAIGLLAVVVGALIVRIRWIDSHGDGSVAVAPATAPITLPVAPPPPLTATAAAARGGDTPADVPPEEWARMQQALSATPKGRQQLPRVAAFMTFQHRAQRWEALQQQGDHSPEKTQLAQELLDDLPTHVGLGELTGFEARALEAQLLMDTVPDPTLRQQAMIDETARINAAAPQPDPQLAVQMAAYKQQEAAITAQWLAMAPSARDPKWLEGQLDAARRQAFDGVGGTQTP